MQRSGCELTEEYVDGYIKSATKYKGACDNIWLATPYGYPPKEVQKQSAERMKVVAEKFRAKGISVSLQVSNTVGHGDRMCVTDCSGLVYEGSPAEKLVGEHGAKAKYSFCWRGKHFREYINEIIGYFVQAVKPDVVWIDDDFRASHHSPVDYGCFCDDCMRAFNQKYQSNFTREALFDEILYGDIEWRKKYMDFLHEGLYDFIYEIGCNVHKISPETPMGFCPCFTGTYEKGTFSHICDAMRDSTGHIPLVRPGGGIYNDHVLSNFFYKALSMNWQTTGLPEYVERTCPEIENLPFVIFGKQPVSTAFETTYYFANGYTDMTYSMLMTQNEPWEFYEKTFKLFAKNRRYWERLSDCNKHSYQSGLRYFISDNEWAKKITEEQGATKLDEHYASSLFEYLRAGIPFAFDNYDDRVTILHPDIVSMADDEEIRLLLRKNVVTDGETIELLSRRGFDLGFTSNPLSLERRLRLYEVLEKHSSNKGNLKEWHSSYFTPGKKEAYYFDNLSDDIEVIGRYANSSDLQPFTKDGAYGVSSLITKTKFGGKWAVFGYEPWKGVVSFARREQFLNAVDYVSDNSLATRLRSPVEAILFPRVDKDRKTVCVSAVNCTIGESGTFELIIRNPKTERFIFMAQNGIKKKLCYKKEGKDYVVKMPSLAPWTVGTVFCDR